MSVDRYLDDEVDIDVEQCSDSENPSRTSSQKISKLPLVSPPCPSDEERLTPEPVQVSYKQTQFNFSVSSIILFEKKSLNFHSFYR